MARRSQFTGPGAPCCRRMSDIKSHNDLSRTNRSAYERSISGKSFAFKTYGMIISYAGMIFNAFISLGMIFVMFHSFKGRYL